jgi:hypothetical protein
MMSRFAPLPVIEPPMPAVSMPPLPSAMPNTCRRRHPECVVRVFWRRDSDVSAAAFAVALGLMAAAAHAASGSAGERAGSCPPLPRQRQVHVITRPRWLSGTLVTEYFPVREAWFRGRPMAAPGLMSRHRVDWFYGAHGVAMNGEGIGLDRRVYHFTGPYGLNWVNADGVPTLPCWNGRWTEGKPSWYGGGWRNGVGAVTYPLAAGGWSNGPPRRFVRLTQPPRFAIGPSSALDYWKRVAVDPKLIPLGSRVFIPAYCSTPAHGWFTAGDVGGAIIARHIDVFRAPPPSLVGLHARWNQTIYVVPPGTTPLHPPRCRFR